MRHIAMLLALAATAAADPPEVAVIHPVQRQVFDHVDVTGRIGANMTVGIRPRVTGYLDKVAFREGSTVKKGDVLFQIDDRIQRAELERVEAQIRQTEAALKLAEAEHTRMTKIVQQGGAVREELDRTAAGVETAKAAMLAAKATLDLAKLNLAFTRIASPIDGRIGRACVTAGNLVRDGDLLATVLAVDPVNAVFDLDERSYLRLRHFQQERKDPKLTVGLSLIDDKEFPRLAAVDFVDTQVDPKNGTIQLRAVLPNPKGEILPGLFVRVRVPLGEPRPALLVPREAVLPVGGPEKPGYAVLVVNEKGLLERHEVTLGGYDARLVVIEKGVKAEDQIVTKPQKLKAGDEVKPQSKKDPPVEE
jgi:RND family efflux transporter MFP subunit